MALKIYKTVTDPVTGEKFEIEGTEAEVEAFEKKIKKKNETVQRKKEILHGKAAKSLKKQDTLDELKKFIAAELAKFQAVREIHHWYFNNGWWWYPRWDNGIVTYYYSQQNPSTVDVNSILTCTDATQFKSSTGVDPTAINTYAASNSVLVDSSKLIYGDATNKWSLTYTTSDFSNAVVSATKNDGSVN